MKCPLCKEEAGERLEGHLLNWHYELKGAMTAEAIARGEKQLYEERRNGPQVGW